MLIYKVTKNILSKFKFQLIIFCIINISIAAISMLVPIISGQFIDELLKQPNFSVIKSFCILLISISILNIIISYIFNIFGSKLRIKMSYELNSEVLFRIQEYPYIKSKTLDAVYTNQRINADTNITMTFLTSFIENIIVNSLTIIFILVYVISINKVLGGGVLLLGIIYIIMFSLMKTKLAKIKNSMKECSAKYYTSLQEQIKDIKFIKTSGSLKFIRERLGISFQNLLKMVMKNQKLSFVFQSSEIIIFLCSQLMLFYVGGKGIIEGTITIGTFSILSGYFSKLISSLKYFITLGNDYIDATVSAKRLYEYLEIDPEKYGTIVLEQVQNIKLENLSFGYYYDLIHNQNYLFEKGKIYSVIGNNGNGKSTLIDLICGLYKDKYTGKVLMNNIDIKKINLPKLYNSGLTYCLQESILIEETIKGNIIFDNDEVEQAKLNELIEGLRINDLYERNDINDLNAAINQGLISGGEQQKISLIRSLIKKSDILILDEPTANLDFDCKKFLTKYLKEISREKIIIVVTHDDEIIKVSDSILKL